MKNILLVFICSLFTTFSYSKLSYSISNWYEGKKAAVTLSFDDWTIGHSDIVLPELNKRGMVGTFYLNLPKTKTITWDILSEAVIKGHEIGNHTFTHRKLTLLKDYNKEIEIGGAKKEIEYHLPTGTKVLTLAYPFGTVNGRVIELVYESGHIGARGVNRPRGIDFNYDFSTSVEDYYDLPAYSMHSHHTVGMFASQLDEVIKGGGWLTYLYHSVYNDSVNDNSYARIHQDSLQLQLDTLSSLKNDLWICTYAQALQYHREKKSAQLIEISKPFESGNTWALRLSDELLDSKYYQALTINVAVPKKVKDKIVAVQIDGKPIDYEIKDDLLIFNGIPDQGDIIIRIDK